MTAGLHAVNLANKWLNMLAGTAFTAPSAFYVQLHNGDPGSAGTANLSTGATGREAVSWSVASGGSKSESAAPTAWTAGGTDTITHISCWDASSSGNFLLSAALSVSRAVISGDTVTLNTLTIAFSPIAA